MHTIAKYYNTWFFLLKRMLQTYAINFLFIFYILFVYKQIKIQNILLEKSYDKPSTI